MLGTQRIVKPAVDAGNLPHPNLPFFVLHGHDLIMWPIEVIGNIGYLLTQAIEGVAGYPPRSAKSIAN